MAITDIHLPVIRALRVDNYQLLPGRDKAGLAHKFLPGVTVIAGINSLGKTTLLNIMLRLLLGGRQPVKAEQRDIGTGAHEMTDGETSLFAEKVLDDARDATAEGEFAFGKRIALIRRSLQTLEILELQIDGKVIKGDQAALHQRIISLSGTDDEFDFYFLVRSFTFFLEDKASLIWNERGQFEVFRILCLPPAKAREYAQLADEILKKDSEYRNKRVPVRRLRKELEAERPADADVKQLRRESELLRIRIDALREQNEELSGMIGRATEKRSNMLERSERVSLELEVAGRELEQGLEQFFARAFPSLPDAVKVILGQITSEKGCLVCSNPQPAFPRRYRDLAAKNCCPFCDRQLAAPAAVVAKPKLEAARLDAAEERVKGLRDTLTSLQKEIAARDTDVTQLYEKKRDLSLQIIELEAKRTRVQQQLPSDEAELDEKWKFLKERERELDSIREHVEGKSQELKKLLTGAREALEALKSTLTERFTFYSGHFLAERCLLEWTAASRRIGQEDPLLEYPALQIQMTSGASGNVVTLRRDSDQVSESQKEFIDLAFRMALFDAVKGSNQTAMLVIETPEASLDTVFVENAGRLLRMFAVGDGNVVVASTNVNGSKMIRSLLGLDEAGRKSAGRDIAPYLVNLLDEAAPNAAMREHGPRYRADLQTALALNPAAPAKKKR